MVWVEVGMTGRGPSPRPLSAPAPEPEVPCMPVLGATARGGGTYWEPCAAASCWHRVRMLSPLPLLALPLLPVLELAGVLKLLKDEPELEPEEEPVL